MGTLKSERPGCAGSASVVHGLQRDRTLPRALRRRAGAPLQLHPRPPIRDQSARKRETTQLATQNRTRASFRHSSGIFLYLKI